MTLQTFNEVLISRVADGTTISNTVTETVMVPDYTFPANYFYQGRTVRGTVIGVSSNVVTTPGTLTMRVRMGAATLSATYVVASQAISLDTTARTNFSFFFEFVLVCRSSGTAGTAHTMGNIELANPLSTTPSSYLFPQSAPAAGTLNTEIANVMSVSAQFSVATSPTNLTSKHFVLEALT